MVRQASLGGPFSMRLESLRIEGVKVFRSSPTQTLGLRSAEIQFRPFILLGLCPLKACFQWKSCLYTTQIKKTKGRNTLKAYDVCFYKYVSMRNEFFTYRTPACVKGMGYMLLTKDGPLELKAQAKFLLCSCAKVTYTSEKNYTRVTYIQTPSSRLPREECGPKPFDPTNSLNLQILNLGSTVSG